MFANRIFLNASNGRYFREKQKKNGFNKDFSDEEHVKRQWFIRSYSTNDIYCFPCTLLRSMCLYALLFITSNNKIRISSFNGPAGTTNQFGVCGIIG